MWLRRLYTLLLLGRVPVEEVLELLLRFEDLRGLLTPSNQDQIELLLLMLTESGFAPAV